MAAGLFSPTRELTGSGTPGLTPMGRLDSDTLYFFVPNSALSYHLSPNPYVDVVGISLYGNGANTDYPAVARPVGECGGETGVYCRGAAGIDLQQYFMTMAAAKEIAPGLAIGVGPVVAMQQFRAKGLSLFAPTPDSPDTTWGYGVRGGLEWSLSPSLRIGGAFMSRTYMGSYSKYANLLAEQADCDVPANGQAGVAYDVQPNLTLMLDYQYIGFGSIPCVANPAINLLFAPFGADNGPGFGWRDIDAVKFGMEWRLPTGLTLRAGYSYNTALIEPQDVQLDILAPATTQHHLTGGGELRLDQDWSLELAAMYAPQSTVSGAEITPGPGHGVAIATQQYEVMLGIKYFYDAATSR
jgi:long-chain fatty acid transport protein